MVQEENGNKAGNNDRYKRERGHQRGPQIQLMKASEAIERASGSPRRGHLREKGSQRQLGRPQALWRASDAAERASEAAERASEAAERASEAAERALEVAEKASEAVESALKAADRITRIVGRALEATGRTFRKQKKKRNEKS